MICKTNWYFLKKEDFMVKGHTSLRDKLQLKLPFHRNGGLGGPCAHCKLIDSGDVALYGVTCPQCGEIPPSRRHRYPQLSNGHVRFDLSNSACILYWYNNKKQAWSISPKYQILFSEGHWPPFTQLPAVCCGTGNAFCWWL